MEEIEEEEININNNDKLKLNKENFSLENIDNVKINENMIKKFNKNELSYIVNNLQNKNDIQKNELDNLHNKINQQDEEIKTLQTNNKLKEKDFQKQIVVR